MVVLDVSIVNVALPRMGHDLHFTSSSAQWVVNAYVLTFAGFLFSAAAPPTSSGGAGCTCAGIAHLHPREHRRRLRRNRVRRWSPIRAIQGIGGAILSPATLTIIVTTFHGPRLPKAIGAWSAVAGAAARSAALGGILTGWASWRWVFFINVPIGIVAAIVARDVPA